MTPDDLPALRNEERPERVACPNCCRLARVTERRMGLLFYVCELCEAVGAIPEPTDSGREV